MTTYDVIVVGTGAGGGIAIKTLCAAGLKVCALNAGRDIDPKKDFRQHRMPWEMKFRGYGSEEQRAVSYGKYDSEYVSGVWEHDIAFQNAPGTHWMWPRVNAVGGKTNFWGRSSARFGDIDFKAASRDGAGVDWPVDYAEMAPFYSRVEREIGVASTIQNRPSNPDGDYLPAMKFRCLDYILADGAKKLKIPYLPDRIAQLTKRHNGHPACHYCANCSEGCDTGSFFSSPYFMLPAAKASGNLELRTNALVRGITVDQDGRANGVAYVDRLTRQEVEVRGRAVVVAAGCISSAQILLNSRSRHWPTGIANSSGELGRNLCDHMYGLVAYGHLPQLEGAPSMPDNVSSSTIAWMPRWQNLSSPHEEKFVRGYSVYPGGGCKEFPSFYDNIEGFGLEYRRAIKRRYPTPVSFGSQIPTLPSPKNFVDISPDQVDIYGIPQVRVHFEWEPNSLKMLEHARHSCRAVLESAGGVFEGSSEQPQPPGASLHETGVCRMGNDPKRFVTNRWGQTHDVPNLYVADASVFPDCTDKTTTLSILAFSLRTSEYLVTQLKNGGHTGDTASPKAGQ